jgi:hypothetical protein
MIFIGVVSSIIEVVSFAIEVLVVVCDGVGFII